MLLDFSDRTRTGISKLISRCAPNSSFCLSVMYYSVYATPTCLKVNFFATLELLKADSMAYYLRENYFPLNLIIDRYRVTYEKPWCHTHIGYLVLSICLVLHFQHVLSNILFSTTQHHNLYYNYSSNFRNTNCH